MCRNPEPACRNNGQPPGLLNGSGVGTCTGAGHPHHEPLPDRDRRDFLGSSLNGGASITAGLQSCTQQMMQATQDRLNQMPQLLSEVQACHDQACATAIGDRIQLETATINAQQQQAQLHNDAGAASAFDCAGYQILQKQRGDYEQVINGTSGVGTGGSATPTFFVADSRGAGFLCQRLRGLTMRRHLLATTFLAFALPATAQTFTVSASGGFTAPDGQRWDMRGLTPGCRTPCRASPMS